MPQKKQAFTLVELIVVITILAILWTIAFISLQWYSKNSRDSVRTSDMSKIRTSLELFNIWSWKYPQTTSWSLVSYSWAEVWNQWTFWELTFKIVDKLDKIPRDPLTNLEYTYSLLNTKQEYELAWILEWDNTALNDSFSKTFADEKLATAKVTWTYNWQVSKVTILWTTYVLALPSIITSNSWTELDLMNIVNNWELVFNNYSNLPANYSNSSYNVNWEWSDFNIVNTWSIVVFSWDISKLLGSNTSYRVDLVENLQKAYSWTLIENDSTIKELTTIDLTETYDVETLWLLVVNNSLGWNIAIKWEVIIDRSYVDYIFSEIAGWFKLNISFSWEEVTWYIESEMIWWICVDSSCWSTVIRDKNTGALSWYALSEIFWWIKMNWVTLSDDGSMSWYAESELLWHIRF